MQPSAGKVRAIAVLVVLHQGSIFVFEGRDLVKGETFYRPLGGTIEFGEHSSQTVVRELREEIQAEITALRFLGTCENVFTHNGQPGHEIVLVYQGEFTDASFYATPVRMGREDNGEAFRALWMRLADFSARKFPLYPDGLFELLASQNLTEAA